MQGPLGYVQGPQKEVQGPLMCARATKDKQFNLVQGPQLEVQA